MDTDVIQQILPLDVLLSCDGRPGDKGEDRHKAYDESEREQDEEDGLAVGIVSNPSLEVAHQDSTTNQTSQESRQGIDQHIGPESISFWSHICRKQDHVVINGLPDRKEYPYPCDPQNLLQLTSGPENLKQDRDIGCIRVLSGHDIGYDSNTDAKVG